MPSKTGAAYGLEGYLTQHRRETSHRKAGAIRSESVNDQPTLKSRVSTNWMPQITRPTQADFADRPRRQVAIIDIPEAGVSVLVFDRNLSDKIFVGKVVHLCMLGRRGPSASFNQCSESGCIRSTFLTESK